MSDTLKDHDEILSLKNHFEDFKENVLRQFGEFSRKLDENFVREEATEKFIGGMGYDDFTKQVKEDAEWVHDFRGGWKQALLFLHGFYIAVIIIISLLSLGHFNLLKLFNFP